jgi:fructose transport system permease protein
VSDTTTSSTSEIGYDAAEEFLGHQTTAQRLQSVLHNNPWISPAAVLVLAAIAFQIVNANFFGGYNLGTIAQQTSFIGALAIGQTIVILTAGIDLSCGAIMVFTSMIMAKLAFANGLPAWLTLIIGVVVGTVAGAVNGLLVTRIKLPPFIVTLGMWFIWKAITSLYAGGSTVRSAEIDPLLIWLGGQFNVFGAPITRGVILMLILFAIFAYIMRYTAWGRHVYASGDDPGAARLAGIEVDRVVLTVYLVAGVIYGISAWILLGFTPTADPNNVPDVNLDTITAVVIGGTSLFGGRGTVIGTLIGAFIVTAFRQGLTLAGLDPAYQTLAVGVLIIAAVAADQWIRKARA